jgi:hypothetical protein
VAIDASVIIDGVAAGTVASAVGNYNTRNDRIATTPATVTMATDGTAIDHSVNPNGTVDIRAAWTSTDTIGSFDGFEAMVYSSTSSSAYTPGTSPLLEQRSSHLPTVNALVLPGVTPNRWYTIAIRGFRVVDADINANQIIYGAWKKSTVSGENPYRPSSSIAIDASVLINGTSAANVATWSGYAQLAINSDGTIKNDLVGEGAIIPGSINTAGFVRQSSTYNMTIDGEPVDGSPLSAGAITITAPGTSTLNISALIPFEIAVVSPVLGTEYTLAVKLELFKYISGSWVSQGFSQEFTQSDIWFGASTAGYQTLGRRTIKIEFQYVATSASGDWSIGWAAQAGPSNRGNIFNRFFKIERLGALQ